MSPVARFGLLVGAWLLWMAPFVFRRRSGEKAVQIDPRARWGIVLQSAGFFIVYTHGPRFWNAPMDPWRLIPGIVFALLGSLLAWTAVASLGRQWRIDAGLNASHELVQTGAYRYV